MSINRRSFFKRIIGAYVALQIKIPILPVVPKGFYQSFYGGSAGAGKSELIRHQILFERMSGKEISVISQREFRIPLHIEDKD